MTFASPCMVALHVSRPDPDPESYFRTLLNEIEGNGNPQRGLHRGSGVAGWLLAGTQAAARANSMAGASSAALCGQPEQQAWAQGPRASSIMVVMVRAQRPHSALQPRQP